MKRFILILLALGWLLSVVDASAQGIFLETENFPVKGGWQVDQQFMDLMGSPYLIAHGMGKPVEDASTTVDIPEAGVYHVWVRSYNWTSPWTAANGPGAFRVKIQGKPMKGILGNAGNKWGWQYAGNVKLKAGPCALALSDLTGFDGRCDAVWICPDRDVVPPEDVASLEAFRRQVGALPAKPDDGGDYDFVVIGGGIAGMCAAVSAARFGCKVALVNDRPIPGGNNSSEIRVHLGAFIEQDPYPALGRMLREFGHSKGGNAQPASNYEDDKKIAFLEGQEGLTYLPNYRAVAVNMDGSKIASVVIRNIESGREVLLKAPVFADCTGDANLGFMAGADWMMGREGRDEYGESLAPEKADKMTMGSSVQWYSVDDGKKSSFPEFEYGVKFTEENCEKVKMGEWTWETGMNLDQIYDFERIRDYGLLVVYSNWSFLHEDASFTLTWHFDLHFPDPANSANFPGNEFKAETKHNPIYPYAAPYRCLYSRNIDNLFMAGRDISTTHVTLGSTRLMRTGAMMGEVVGMAASICKDKGTTPRGVYQHYLPELKALMRKGAARTDIDLPDNQHFNTGGHLDKPKDITF